MILKTEIWWKREFVLYGYSQFDCIQKKNTDICEDIADGVETWFDISNYELDKLFPEGKNQK